MAASMLQRPACAGVGRAPRRRRRGVCRGTMTLAVTQSRDNHDGCDPESAARRQAKYRARRRYKRRRTPRRRAQHRSAQQRSAQRSGGQRVRLGIKLWAQGRARGLPHHLPWSPHGERLRLLRLRELRRFADSCATDARRWRFASEACRLAVGCGTPPARVAIGVVSDARDRGPKWTSLRNANNH